MKTDLYSEIPYEVKPMFSNCDKEDDSYLYECITNCPFGQCIGHSTGNVIKVGSIAEDGCEYYKRHDGKKKVVWCSHPDNFKD